MARSVSHADQAQDSLWQENRDVLKRLYLVEGKTASQVKEIMESEHAFPEFP